MFSCSDKIEVQTAADPKTAEQAFRLYLSDLPGWFLEATCCYSKTAALKWFLDRCGDQRLGDFIARLTCSHCGGRPQHVHVRSAPYHQPSLTGTRQLVLIGSEDTHWLHLARARGAAKERVSSRSVASDL